jgi:hypothetical protein
MELTDTNEDIFFGKQKNDQNDDDWWVFFLLFILCFDPLTFRNSAVAPALGEMKFLPLSLSLTGWKEVHIYVDLHQNCEQIWISQEEINANFAAV